MDPNCKDGKNKEGDDCQQVWDGKLGRAHFNANAAVGSVAQNIRYKPVSAIIIRGRVTQFCELEDLASSKVKMCAPAIGSGCLAYPAMLGPMQIARSKVEATIGMKKPLMHYANMGTDFCDYFGEKIGCINSPLSASHCGKAKTFMDFVTTQTKKSHALTCKAVDYVAENLKKIIEKRIIPAKLGKTVLLSKAHIYKSIRLGEVLQPQCVQITGYCAVRPCIQPKAGVTIKFTNKLHEFDVLTGLTTDG